MLTYDEMIKKMLENQAVRAEYEDLKPEFVLLDELLKARHQAGLTQEEVAKRMGMKTHSVSRLEAGITDRKSSLSVAVLQKYANAVNCSLEIRLIPR